MPTEIRFKAAARFLGGETPILIAPLQNGVPENQGILLEFWRCRCGRRLGLGPWGIQHADSEWQEHSLYPRLPVQPSGVETVSDGVHGGDLAAGFGFGSVGFCAVGTGGVDFSLGGHGCTELSLRRGGSVDCRRIW
jgi:hypothetical protein